MKKNKALENKAIQVTVGSIPVTGLIIVPANDTLPIGDELVLQYIFAPEDTTERDYEIGGYNSSVVRVSEDGVVHALADGSTTITVTATNGTKDTSDDKTATCVITVVKHDSRVSEARAAKNLIYNGEAQELVTAGTASGGTMQYALGENATTAPADNLIPQPSLQRPTPEPITFGIR